MRTCAASLLAMQGLRATSRGGHVAIQDAVAAQSGASISAFKSFGRIRRARNRFEYPASDSPGPSAADIADVIAVAKQARDAAAVILANDMLTGW